MTTESKEEERSIDTLLNLAYSEMTDDEISRVVEYKSDLKAHQADYEARKAALEQHQAELITQAQAACDKAFEVQNALYEASLQRLRASMGGGDVSVEKEE